MAHHDQTSIGARVVIYRGLVGDLGTEIKVLAGPLSGDCRRIGCELFRAIYTARLAKVAEDSARQRGGGD